MIVLKPQDIVVMLKIVSLANCPWTYAQLSGELFISASEIHAAVKRCALARLLDSELKKPFARALEEFVVHGVKYAFPANQGGMARGMATAHAAPPLNREISQADEIPPVWPDPVGQTRGFTLLPLYRTVPRAAAVDPAFYELMALVDAIRIGRAREREIAAAEIGRRIAEA